MHGEINSPNDQRFLDLASEHALASGSTINGRRQVRMFIAARSDDFDRDLKARPRPVQCLFNQTSLRKCKIAPASSEDDSFPAHLALGNTQRSAADQSFAGRRKPAAEIVHVLVDNLLSGFHLLPAQGDRLLGDRLQGIDVI